MAPSFPPGANAAGRRAPVVWAGLALVMGALAAYHNSFSGPLVFDDISAIAENPSIRQLTALDRVLTPPRDTGAGGRPLANLTYAINYAMGGESPRGYHVTNFLLHAAAGLVLFGIVRRTLTRAASDPGAAVPSRRASRSTTPNLSGAGLAGDAGPRRTFEERLTGGRRPYGRRHRSDPGDTAGLSPLGFAFAVALLWVLHPLTTASVTYISQRTELLMALCYLLTMYGFVRAVELRPAAAGVQRPAAALPTTGGQTAASDGEAAGPGSPAAVHGRRHGARRQWLTLSVVACGLGMASKEAMVTAPVAVLVFDRIFHAGSFRAALRLRGGYYLALGTTWLLLALLMTTGLGERGVGYSLGVTWWQYATTELTAVLLYLVRALWPHPLIFDYGALYQDNVAVVLGCALGIAGLLVATGWLLRWRPAPGFAAAWVFLVLAPTSTVVPVAEQPMAENRMYLPLAGLTVLALAGVQRLGRRRVVALVAAAATGFGVLAVQRNADYADDVRLWSDTMAKRPLNPRAHYNGGLALLRRGEAAPALARFQEAVRLKPDHAEAHASAGTALLQLGRAADALPWYERALQLNPVYPRAHYNYGLALFRAGDLPRAIASFERALQQAPELADAHTSLGNALFQLDRTAEALRHYEQALRIDAGLVDAHYNAGNACLELGRVDEAIGHFAAAVRFAPDDAELRNNFGGALLTAGRRAEAMAQFEHALRLRPGYADARSNLELARAAADGEPR
jgi:protein O-mannosyl-transferase